VNAAEPLAPYNRIFERLVVADDDVVGLVAYSVYKRHKRDWIVQQIAETGLRPDLGRIREFERINQLDSQLNRYRQSAADLLATYANEAVEYMTPAIRESTLTMEIATVAADARSASDRMVSASSLPRQVFAGVASAFVYTLLLIAFALVLRYAGIDLVDVIDAAGA
jgi:hypothetical protein